VSDCLAWCPNVRTKGTSGCHDWPLLILCPACGADKLIPLTFPLYRRQGGPEVEFRRPFAKCSSCGERIYAHIATRSRLAVEEPDAN